MRTSMLICVAAVGLFACRNSGLPHAPPVRVVDDQQTGGSTGSRVFDVNCTGRDPKKSNAFHHMYACAKRDGAPYEIDAKHADYVWAVFAGINRRAPEQDPAPAWGDWRTWYSSDVPVAETCSLRGRGTDRSGPPKQQPLVDRDGNRIRYEVRYHSEDPHENENARLMLASVTEQLQVMCDGTTVINAWGRHSSSDDLSPVLPAIRLKLAWKKLSEAEQRAAREGKLISDNPAQPREGLVAVHLAIKTATSSDWWTWATFSHVGNLATVEELGPFFEPCKAGEQCNTCPEHGRPTPLRRVHRPSAEVESANRRHRRALQKNDPLWWYELVGVQRAEKARTSAPATSGHPAPPPVYRPTFLASEIIEWDRQEDSSCIGCHDKMKMWSPEPGTSDTWTEFCDACQGRWGEVTVAPGTGKYVQVCAGQEFPIGLFDVRNEQTGFSTVDMFGLPGRVRPHSSSSDVATKFR